MAKRKNKKIDLENNRYGLFMNDQSFDLEIMYGRHYLENDVKFLVSIYRVNIIESKAHKLYGQAKAKDRKYFSPFTINAMVEVGADEQSNYGESDGGIAREDISEIIIKVYLDELAEKNQEINRGDIIEYNPSGDRDRYFEVSKADNVSDSTEKTIAGLKPYFRKIIAVPVKEDVSAFLKGDSLT